jgi:hypothetical protein
MTLVSSSVVMTAPGLMSVPTLTRRSRRARERRADHGVFSRAFAAASRARFAFSVASSCRSSTSTAPALRQLAAAVVQALALVSAACGAADVGARLRIVELHQHLAALHAFRHRETSPR